MLPIKLCKYSINDYQANIERELFSLFLFQQSAKQSELNRSETSADEIESTDGTIFFFLFQFSSNLTLKMFLVGVLNFRIYEYSFVFFF